MPEALHKLRDFRGYASAWWHVYDKWGTQRQFNLTRAQALCEDAYLEAIRNNRPVRILCLKYRQGGISTWATARLQHSCQTEWYCNAISIADKQDLCIEWLRRCRGWHGETPPSMRPHAGATNANELWFDKLQSRYSIGSAEGQTPGMGHCLRRVHLSEVKEWLHPEAVWQELNPAIPPGPGTAVIIESTAGGVGDWWYKLYYAAKRGENGYKALFLPWYLQDEYRIDAPGEILGYSDTEKALIAAGCDDAQLAWRRKVLRDEFHNDEAQFANKYPSTDTEAFLAGGRCVFNHEQVTNAFKTVRKPVWVGDILPGRNPIEFKLSGGEGGYLKIWDHDPKRETPDDRYHYVIGADCQWGTKETSDFDCAFVQCLETNKICAKIKGQFDLSLWGRLLASLGYHYHTAVLAPERNAVASDALMPLLLGNIADWRYPRIWIRVDDVKLKGHRPQDYGWLTDQHTKAEIIGYAKSATLSDNFDWCDSATVEQMQAYITNDQNRQTAPDGEHDDDLMARMITGYVAHRLRFSTELYHEKVKAVFRLRTMQERLAEDADDERGIDDV